MNNLINKKTYQIFIFSFIFIILSLFNINKTSADYYYWTDSIHTGESSFDTKEDCEERLKMVHPSHKTSGSCYESKEVASITSFSPTTGKPYDTITIIGKNLRTIKSIYFNNQISTFDGKTSGSSTEIKVTVPNGATTGPIIINTEFRGIAKSKTNFIINDTDLYWWYLNSTGQIRGVDGHHSLNGFKDKNSCEEAKSEYIKTINSMSLKLSDCFQRTTKEVSEQIKNESKGSVVDVSPGNSPLSTAVSPIYKLLAPIGSLTQIETNNIGSYFNTLFKIAIGLCAALAVIMIIIYGIMHMGSDSVFGKVEAMGKIQNALLGLLLAIGSYVLLNTIDPSLTGSEIKIKQTEVDILLNSNSIYKKTAADGVRCKVLASGPCTVANLNKTFGDKAESMSKICNIESSGNPSRKSDTDIDANKVPFSIGLFQINMVVHGDKFKGTSGNSCSNLFTKKDGSAIVGSNYIQKINGKYVYDVKLNPKYRLYYESCVNTLLDPGRNIEIAKKLVTERGNTLGAWYYSDYDICPSAFK
jgi:hypothetical protein